jgi:NADH-quinone oxidoreductase subunit N
MTAELSTVLPEIVMAVAAMGLLMLGVFRAADCTRQVSVLVILVFAAALLFLAKSGDQALSAFDGLFVVDKFTVFAKGLILMASALTVAMSIDFLEKEKMARFEYPVLVLFASLGMMIMVSAGDFLTLYLGLELQSLPLYVLAAYQRDNSRSTEAGLKYYVLGSLAS